MAKCSFVPAGSISSFVDVEALKRGYEFDQLSQVASFQNFIFVYPK